MRDEAGREKPDKAGLDTELKRLFFPCVACCMFFIMMLLP